MRLPERPPDARRLDRIALLPRGQSRWYLYAEDPAPGGRYRHWDELRRLSPPDGVNHEEWWFAIKTARGVLLKPLPLEDERGRAFRWATPDPVLVLLHQIDREAIGRGALTEPTPDLREYYADSTMDEAITSSQLEGASTTRRVAQEMLRSGRKPRDESERMIVNNYRAVTRLREWKERPLTVELVKEIHHTVCEGIGDGAGRFRRPDEDVYVQDEEGQRIHTPPPAKELQKRVDLMCQFANSDAETPFVHPITRSILLHFWLAYDHPFVDGNGRTARALFYWSMLRRGYPLSEYLSISKIIKKSPSRYTRSFLYVETDDNDVTYFLLSQLAIIKRAIVELNEYVAEKKLEIRATERTLRNAGDLNHRQIAVLAHALKNPDAHFTIEGHKRGHAVVHQTARMDLLDLEKRRYLIRRKMGRQFVFLPAEDLAKRMRR